MSTIHIQPSDWSGVDMADARAILARTLELYHPEVALASSFSMEDCVLMDLLAAIRPDFRVFAIDTGRLPPETYECAEAMRHRYGVRIEWHFPDRNAVEKLEREKGLFSFRESLENRHECCGIRKVEPLRRALKDLKAWIVGLRREQAVTRSTLHPVEPDAGNGGILRIAPLAGWTWDQVLAHVRERKIPYNRLYDEGYVSIGCAPCTRAVQPGDDSRSGRWWWETPEHKECGLHQRPGWDKPGGRFAHGAGI